MTEAQHQKAVFDWSRQPGIRSRFPELALLYHIPNGGSRDAVEAKHLKQQGVKAVCRICACRWHGTGFTPCTSR